MRCITHNLSFRAFDDGPEAATAMTPALAAGERYLAIASGYLSSGAPTFTLLPYGDGFDLSSMDPSVRVVHASPDAPAVDVGTVAGGNVTAVGDFSNLEFSDSSPAGGTILPAGDLPIGVAAAGTTPALAEFTVPATMGLRAFAVAAGSYSGPGETFRLLVVDTGQYPWAAAEILPN